MVVAREAEARPAVGAPATDLSRVQPISVGRPFFEISLRAVFFFYEG